MALPQLQFKEPANNKACWLLATTVPVNCICQLHPALAVERLKRCCPGTLVS